MRAVNMMKNNQLFQRLGLGQLKTMITATTPNNKQGGPQESGSLYDGENVEDSGEEDVGMEFQARKGVPTHIFQARKGVPTHISNDGEHMSTKVTRGNKRIMAPVQEWPVRVTRQRVAEVNQMSTHSLNVSTQPSSSAATNHDLTHNLIVPTHPSSNTATNHEPIQDMDTIAQATFQIQEGDNHTGNQEIIPRRKSMGRQLESLSRGLGIKIPIQITEGNKSPEPPIQAAKFASEGGITLRQHIPIFNHWKEYKKRENEPIIRNYIGKVTANFTVDSESMTVEDACLDMLKSGQRQMRYRLKQKYFNGIPANQVRTTSPIPSMSDNVWRKLVEKWSTPNHKESCVKNKLNREKVQYQQCTGSQSYIAKAFILKQEKYKDAKPSAIDLFKEMQCSKKKGFSENVQKAIVDMEEMVAAPVQDGQQPKSPTEVVSNVLPGSSVFLRNVGLKSASQKSSTTTVSVKVQQLQDELQTEKQEKDGLREEVETLKAQAQASQETIDSMKRSMEEITTSFVNY
ncbi:LOW QUALITY PROTEIN: uncharacterized protein [Zea mays]|uniref:LOW QUALITY PROTEIN: uncharacterized protein n=1 Tax=Zea mays TaxID=4577 RepID=UPI001652C989|nr:LOW QUALITY PROTEIN: uncharacterized protein LOC103635194 [Zea mays]